MFEKIWISRKSKATLQFLFLRASRKLLDCPRGESTGTNHGSPKLLDTQYQAEPLSCLIEETLQITTANSASLASSFLGKALAVAAATFEGAMRCECCLDVARFIAPQRSILGFFPMFQHLQTSICSRKLAQLAAVTFAVASLYVR